MKRVNTPNGYLAVERNGGIDIYMNDCYVCEICGKTMAHYSYDGKVDVDKLDADIDEEIEVEEILNIC